MAVPKIEEYSEQLTLTIEQGATFDITLTWKDENDVLIDLTGYSARMQIRSTISAAASLHELTDSNGGIVLGDAAGTIQLLITAADTAALAFPGKSAVYDLELVNGTVVTRLLRGTVLLSKEVTR